jgi:hypothetical protein
MKMQNLMPAEPSRTMTRSQEGRERSDEGRKRSDEGREEGKDLMREGKKGKI